MALSFLGSGNSSSAVKYFDIRLDDDYVVFRGSEDEASSAHLRGKLVLCLSEPLRVQNIILRLTGASKISWVQPSNGTGNSRKAYKENAFFEKVWTFVDSGKNKSVLIPPGNYEYDFDIILEGSLPESIEGLRDTFMVYRFKAEIGRAFMQKDVHARKPLRIIRTLDPSALELAHAMSVENVWPNKIEYSISTPSKAVVFGTSIAVNFRLVPLLKGLKIGKLLTQLVEAHEFTVEPAVAGLPPRSYKNTRIIDSDEYEIDEEAQLEILDEEAEGYQVSRALVIPRSLNACVQDCDSKGIKVRHKLKFTVQLHNPDGHVSELRATLPVMVFISPSLPIDENNNLVDQTPTARVTPDEIYAAPPLYGEHQFDQLYSAVDPSGYFTPGVASEAHTPFGTHSRNISNENLASLDALTNGNVSAFALRRRLDNLHENGSSANMSGSPDHESDEHQSRPHSSSLGEYFSNDPQINGRRERNSPGSGTLSRRTSEEDEPMSGAHTPHAHYMEVEDLCRVPSYTTAVKQTTRTPVSGDLPDYNSATSPLSSPRNSPPTVTAPRPAHVRSGRGSPPSLGTSMIPDLRPHMSPSFRHHQPQQALSQSPA